jgi:hypothetical protein
MLCRFARMTDGVSFVPGSSSRARSQCLRFLGGQDEATHLKMIGNAPGWRNRYRRLPSATPPTRLTLRAPDRSSAPLTSISSKMADTRVEMDESRWWKLSEPGSVRVIQRHRSRPRQCRSSSRRYVPGNRLNETRLLATSGSSTIGREGGIARRAHVRTRCSS